MVTDHTGLSLYSRAGQSWYFVYLKSVMAEEQKSGRRWVPNFIKAAFAVALAVMGAGLYAFREKS